MLNKIRLKMTLINSVVLFSVLIFISIFVYVNVTYNTITNTDKELIDAAYQLKRFLPLLEQTAAKPDMAQLQEEYDIFMSNIENDGISYLVWDGSDNTIATRETFSFSTNPLSEIRDTVFQTDTQAEKQITQSDGTYYIHLYNYGDMNVRICTAVTSDDNGNMCVIQTLSNMNDKNNMADRLLRTLLLSGLIGFTLSFVSGYFIAGKAIIPIQENMLRQKEFIADASHELRTPVTIIRTNLDVVKDAQEESVASQMNWIDNAYDETERMEKLIADLLFLAKADLNQQDMQHNDIDLNRACKNITDKFIPSAAEKSIRLQFIPSNEPVVILGDENKINQMIVNIIDNAIHYSSQNGVAIISVQKNKNDAYITVKDNGIGIPKEELDNIFTRFYRTDKARTRRAGGTGLGLSIAKWVVQAHKGEISATSEKAAGTTITIRLPLKEGDKQ